MQKINFNPTLLMPNEIFLDKLYWAQCINLIRVRQKMWILQSKYI